MPAEQRHGRLIPSLMFSHIPTYEHEDMWNGGPGATTEAKHRNAIDTFFITGEKHEVATVGAINSRIYAACQERGDVRGIYRGHDHLN
ncbi:hypothetical protein [Corynebacterium cystitidis]|uniref:Uncharacterized protein n=1 Tax=Corynebacterium cystitidis DSM 20524 TaxID=1121357 RepID=A0A1H9QJW7_9CORY|nr:hypothetical protein [Corynebacterium cystitidis]SER60495.1 hypothetical protein SAMN05661109_00563 [Corynebacterium cystitidis DSM 20524]SNV83951.1 Uncharacterised protein [Corynebacterium cystitidis]